MKRIYLFLVAALCSLASFAVEYDSPVTVRSGLEGDTYGSFYIELTSAEVSSLVQDVKIAVHFNSAVANESANSQWFTSTSYIGIGGAEGVHYLSVGDLKLEYVLTEEDAFYIVEDGGLILSGYNCPKVSSVTFAYPKGQTPTGIGEVRMVDIYALNKTIVAPAEARIFNITGQEVTSSNGSLTKGLYVVRVGKQTTKVIVK